MAEMGRLLGVLTDAIPVAAPIVLFLMRWLGAVSVHENGIVAPGFWRWRASIAWDRIASVGLHSNSGIDALRVKQRSGPGALFSLDVARKPEFVRLVKACAGTENPLTAALMRTRTIS